VSTEVTTGEGGSVCTVLPAGKYTVVEEPQIGWTATTPTTQIVVVVPGQEVDVVFGNRKGGPAEESGKLCVFKFLDVNGNGKQDPGEPPLSGWTFQVRDASGAVVATVTTNAQGVVCTALPAGTYSVAESAQPGYAATTATSQSASVVPGQ